jgi:hypothetical protein
MYDKYYCLCSIFSKLKYVWVTPMQEELWNYELLINIAAYAGRKEGSCVTLCWLKSLGRRMTLAATLYISRIP